MEKEMSSYDLNPAEDLHGLIAAAAARDRRMIMTTSESTSTTPWLNSSRSTATATAHGDDEDELKARIASHPRYPRLLQAYIDCQKVGAPAEIASVLDEILENNNGGGSVNRRCQSDPELDCFMEIYCDVLVKYRSDLARPFDEAAAFLNSIQTQLSDLCNNNNNRLLLPSATTCPTFICSDEAAGSSEEEASCGENDPQELHFKGESRDLKDRLLRKYSGCLSSLKQEFSKKKKKGKLPKEARQILLEWWGAHCKWPYPTEADKIALAESTGLDQKQINNWFINQRKRHWKPSESMQLAVMGSLSTPFYED